jgi:hypothetical protein
LADSFAQDPAYRLVHNQDDFLARPEDIKTISERMKNRAIIYPKGGHLGNLWMKQNLSDLYLMVKDLL